MNLFVTKTKYIITIQHVHFDKNRRHICHEVDRPDITGDIVKYYVHLRDYYRRLYNGATYQLSRNLKLLWFV